MTVIPKAPTPSRLSCSPDLAPYVFFPFQELRMALKGMILNGVNVFQEKSQDALGEVQKLVFTSCFELLCDPRVCLKVANTASAVDR